MKPTTTKAIVAVRLALIAATVAYLVVRPAKSDLCASEILINGRGGAVNLKTQTITLGSEAKPVPLETMTNDSQLVIDELSRLCRQHQARMITSEQYFMAVQNLLKRNDKPAAPAKLPLFNGSIGVTGLVDNRPFRRFAEENVGKIVRLNLNIDAGAYNPLGVHFIEQCYHSVDDSGQVQSSYPGMMDNLFGQRFHLVEVEEDIQDYTEVTDEQRKIGCGPVVEFRSNRKVTWSHAGPGLNSAKD